eukprot:TRINITY_DN11142_c0_g1_i2.p1 TRINITY_DN11142_c0_g1~~TRINITY_DN11142_c0_g1_i2.p1  ORF type:complete len:310 (-),score=75.54 TRINITY_DN11142_c0_g1_i2:229-1158(-)
MGAVLDHMPINDETKPMLVGTMNGRYKEALVAYAKNYCGKEDAVSAQIVELDDKKFLLRYWDAEAHQDEMSLDYQDASGKPLTANSAGDCRRILVDMARVSAEKTGMELALPGVSASAATSSDEPSKVPGSQLLNNLIDSNTLECLNQDDAHPITDFFKKAPAAASNEESQEDSASPALQSDPDSDHQLLLKVGFRQPVKLKAIIVQANSEDETAPQVVKIFQGQESIGFQEAEEETPTQKLELSAGEVDSGEPIQLRYVKFQNVSTLQLFVESNFGSDVTRIQKLEFYGTPAETVDMKAWKPGANPIG